MKIERAYIEELKDSIIDADVSFCSILFDNRDILKFRRENMKSTSMFWITKRAVIDSYYNVYNPSALIFIILN